MKLNLEDEFIEYKQSLGEWKEIVETVAALATSKGGIIYIGVSPNGEEKGVPIGSGIIEDIVNKIRTNTDPSQFPSIIHTGSEDAAVITLKVEESPIKPVMAFHRPMKRVGRSNQHITREETQRLMNSTTGHSWDALPCITMTINDIDNSVIESFLMSSGQLKTVSIETVLKNLNLINSDVLFNGAALLFAKNPQRYFPDALVKCARFIGTTSIKFLDERTLDGTLFTQIEDAFDFVMRNIRQELVITGKPSHDIIPEYPEEGVREAIINAVCHRDYTVHSTVQIRIYDDRLEIWNPGILPFDLSIESLYREHPSRPRNPNIANALQRAGLIERWGSGTLRIVESCKSRNLLNPEFIEDMSTFIVRFRGGASYTENISNNKFNDRQKRAVEYIKEAGYITSGVYAEMFGVVERQARRDLTELCNKGMLSRLGKGRGIRYILNKI